jgi:hypothetical protein
MNDKGNLRANQLKRTARNALKRYLELRNERSDASVPD